MDYNLERLLESFKVFLSDGFTMSIANPMNQIPNLNTNHK